MGPASRKNDDQPLVWRGPLKYNVIKQFSRHVMWETLIISFMRDATPGTGDEPLSIRSAHKDRARRRDCNHTEQVATIDVAKCVTSASRLNCLLRGSSRTMRENLSAPTGGQEVDIFSKAAEKSLIPDGRTLPGRSPLDPESSRAEIMEFYILTYTTSENS